MDSDSSPSFDPLRPQMTAMAELFPPFLIHSAVFIPSKTCDGQNAKTARFVTHGLR
ncbi:hypothetical protein RRG08_065359 [Elysia crispata]|uniref:Uncharacterized protein n=1 Tax=Elysia crispata TaxID=231223 RepID=A0AAE1AGB6_9GAST|nr:hypothetical protein RRG08_065359 [Elysia crispata]